MTPVVVYRKSILSRTALIIYGRIRARQWVQRAVTLRRREVYETSLRTSSLCQVIGALRTRTEWRQPYRIFLQRYLPRMEFIDVHYVLVGRLRFELRLCGFSYYSMFP